MSNVIIKDGRELVKEIQYGSTVVEIYRKLGPENGKTYFDYRSCRCFMTKDKSGNEEEAKGPYLQQRDVRDHVRCLMDALEWISDAHRDIRGQSSSSVD